ncbi:hypothetical protein, partial [Pseudomonas sp.]|uniref:hypothetical protein n=1 Tax=Pseudomonas sp. TaxID=306 RepID=UPI001D9396AE
ASAARDCAARAALDLTGAEDAPATLARNHRISHLDRIDFKSCAIPGGATVLLKSHKLAQSMWELACRR